MINYVIICAHNELKNTKLDHELDVATSYNGPIVCYLHWFRCLTQMTWTFKSRTHGSASLQGSMPSPIVAFGQRRLVQGFSQRCQPAIQETFPPYSLSELHSYPCPPSLYPPRSLDAHTRWSMDVLMADQW